MRYAPRSVPTRCIVLSGLVFFFSSGLLSPSFAHEGHDHGSGSESPATLEAEPRVAAESSLAAVTGILGAGRLWVYADRPDTNEPLQDLSLALDVHEVTYAARLEGAGIYSVPAPWASRPGPHDITFILQGRDFEDLLIGTLVVPESSAAPAESGLLSTPLVAAGLAVIIFGYIFVRKGRERLSARRLRASGITVLGAAATVTLVSTAIVAGVFPRARTDLAQPHALQALMRQPVRLPDGSIMVPKPAQRILGIRTVAASLTPVRRTQILNGRVVENPNASALVRAEHAGRLEAPPSGFPVLGGAAKKGDVLGYLRPTLAALEEARREAELHVLEKERYLAARQYERVKAQVGMNDSSSVVLDVARAELRALERQVAALQGVSDRRIAVISPIDGVIGSSSVAIGKIVQVGEDLFRVLDPRSNWVEAVSFQPGLEMRIASATAVLEDGSELPLVYSGHGYRLRNQGLVLQFNPQRETEKLMVGRLVKVRVVLDEAMQGMQLSSASIAGAARSQSHVWVRSGAERFELRRVDVVALDERSQAIIGSIKPGERVVEGGASLLSRFE